MQGKARKGTGARTSKTPAGGGEFSMKSCPLSPLARSHARISPPGVQTGWAFSPGGFFEAGGSFENRWRSGAFSRLWNAIGVRFSLGAGTFRTRRPSAVVDYGLDRSAGLAAAFLPRTFQLLDRRASWGYSFSEF